MRRIGPGLLVLLPPAQVVDALRGLGLVDAFGPHITVKAQPGLDDERRSDWLPAVRRVIAGVEPFDVQLGPVGAFGDQVVFLEVVAEQVHTLHRLLVAAVDPPLEETVRHFELEGWHPHLTLHPGTHATEVELRAAAAELGRLPPFTVMDVWLCRQEVSGACVVEEPLPLGGSRGG